ncbi:MAG: ATP-grasp domain-containing protein [Candidatus Microsaccharimonas sp.]
MNLLEHEAKTLLKTAGIPTPISSLVTKSAPSLTQDLPVVLKSQVPIGGRGKAGGIVIVEDPSKLSATIETLFKLDIKGFTPTALLAEEKLAIQTELYLSLLIDRATAGILLVANKAGGIEVEDTKDFASWQVDYQKPDFDVLGQSLADYYELPGQTFALQDLVQKLFACLKQNDATLIEINPLVLTEGDSLIAGDCKLTLDDAAAFRHPEWDFTTKAAEANFVTINPEGNVATIANGAGLAMATVDAAYSAGLVPINFLDIGGGANTETLVAAFKRITDYSTVQAIIINIFAGITRSDEVARAIIAARQHITNLPPLFIRLAGTNYQEAADLLSEKDIAILPNLEACLEAAKEVVHE